MLGAYYAPNNYRRIKMLAVILFTGFVAFTNQEFFATVEENIEDGYTWEYVGKQSPDGNPAITIKPENGDEYILFKMTK